MEKVVDRVRIKRQQILEKKRLKKAKKERQRRTRKVCFKDLMIRRCDKLGVVPYTGKILRNLQQCFCELKPIDFVVLHFFFKNISDKMNDKQVRYEQSTNLMWKLKMSPTHYTDLKLSLAMLYKHGLLERKNMIRKRKIPAYGYRLTEKGGAYVSVALFISSILGQKDGVRVVVLEDESNLNSSSQLESGHNDLQSLP